MQSKPTRPVTDPRFKYVPSTHTDIRRTFRKIRLLQRLQQRQVVPA